MMAGATDPTLATARQRAAARLDSDPAGAAREAIAILRQAPDDPHAGLVLGAARRRLGDEAGAREILEPLARAQTGSAFVQFELGLTLAGLGEPAAAVEALRRAVALRDDLSPAWRGLAEQLTLLGEEAEAARLLARHLEGASPANRARTWLAYGHVLKAGGRGDDAAEAYREAIVAEPGLGEAYWSLANLKAGSLSLTDEASMVAQLQRGDLATADRLHLHYALGEALEGRGKAVDSFEQYRLGSALHRTQVPYDARAAHDAMRRTKALFTREFFAARAEGGSASDAPIFIVGLPRSGSTLIEQILASHSQVEGTGELPDLIAMAASLRGSSGAAAYPDVLAGLNAGERRALGETYLERTAVYRKLGRPRFIDKMPNNFHHIGLIHLILPRAKIIDARRHPMAGGFAAFRQHFARGHAWSYDLGDLGRYYRDYLELMGQFDAALPGRVGRVIHEDLVADLEGETRRLLAWCGLAFEAPCLRFWETTRAVRTASAEQVRRPIFRDGVHRWRDHEAQLAPLRAALGPALETWRN